MKRKNIFQHIESAMMCLESVKALAINEDALTIIDSERDNEGMMSPSSEANDIIKANKKILTYIDSLNGKQRIITPAQLSKELGMSELFIEGMLIANGFEEDY
jgi:hypothetical protein